METFKKNGYTFYKDGGIFINSMKINSCIEYIKKNKISCIYINENFDFNLSNLDFLKEIDFIEKIGIETDVKDLAGINYLGNLVYLSISSMMINQEINFLNFPQLEYCNITPSDNTINLDKCFNLKEISLWGVNSCDLAIIKGLNIEKISVYNSKIESLKGLEETKSLKQVTLEGLKKLESIDSLLSSKETLEFLALRNCKKFKTYETIKQLVNLKKLDLVNCGESQSADFFEPLQKLEYCYSETNILDGDVSILMEMPVMFKNYKHYNHKNNIRIKRIKGEGAYLTRNKDVLYKLY